MFWKREDPVIAILREEVTYLRAQLEAGREREDRLRHEVITLASSRAAADIAFYETSRKAPLLPPPGVWPAPRPEERTIGPFDNHLAGGGHLEPDPETPPAAGQPISEDAMAEATIERAAKERERARLPTMAD